MRIRLLAFAAAVLVGCTGSGSLRLDATSDAHLKDSLEALVKAAPPEKSRAATSARQAFREAYWPETGAPDPSLPDAQLVHRMDLDQFIHFATNLQGAKGAQDVPAYASARDLREEYRRSLALDRDLLEAARENAHKGDRFTIDQFELGRLDVQPPGPEAAKGNDEIRFVVPIINNSGFDIYKPTIRLALYRPDNPQPVYDNELMSLNEDVIPAGSTADIVVRCCSSTGDPRLNALMRNLPSEYTWRWSLVDVRNFAGRSSLDTTLYTQANHDELLRVRDCLGDMDAKGDAWTPASAAPSCNG